MSDNREGGSASVYLSNDENQTRSLYLALKERYYFIATDDYGQRKIHIRSATILEVLADENANEVLLWDGNIPVGERHGQHWAPELYVIGGRLY